MATGTIKTLILNNQIDDALAALNAFWETHQSLPNECLLLRSQLKRQIQDLIAGNQSVEEKNVLENRVIWALIEKIEAFEKNYDHYFRDNQKFDASNEGFKERIEAKFVSIYTNITELSNGESAIIYKAIERSSNRTIIIKALKTYDFAADTIMQDEMKIMQKMNHRNIIEIDCFYAQNYPICTILSYINGIDLKKIIRSSGKRTFSETKEIVLKLLDALQYLHEKGIYVRFLEPDNILIDTEGEPVLSPPFRILKPNYAARTIEQMKTDFAYLSNHQIDNNTFQGSVRCNLFSMGLLSYFLLTGEHLFYGESLPKLLEDRHLFFNSVKYQKEKLKKLNRADVPSTFIKILVKLLTDNFDWDARQLIRKVQECFTEEHENQVLVKESYQRAFFRNENFLSDFYAAYLKQSPIAQAKFEEAATARSKTFNADRQAKMLHYAINLIIESSEKNNFLDNIFQNPWHKGLPKEEFNIFLQTLKESVKQCDNLWNNRIHTAWDEVIAVNLRLIHNMIIE
jgi:serine/threonine protein kinase